MNGMTWQERDVSDGSAPGVWCEFVLSEGQPTSRMDVYETIDDKWTWSVDLFASEYKQKAYGYGCANESKAKHMAMHLVAALLQIMDGVRPHEVD
jgi:hypothetical protein